MARFSRSNEVVVRDIEAGPRVGKFWRDRVTKFFGRLAGSIRSLANFEPVFIGTG